jgi:signal peptide peptidase SppA
MTMNALQYIKSVPWMILEDYLDDIEFATAREGTPEEIAARVKEARKLKEQYENSPVSLAAKQGERLEGSRSVSIREGGVAILQIRGPIFRYAGLFDDVCPVTSTEMLAYDFNVALSSSRVTSIINAINSPGGEAFGIANFARMIAERSIDKPVLTYFDGYGASAAFYIGVAADEIVASPDSLLGSIGTVMESTDYTKAYAQRGIERHRYVSNQSPNKRPKLGTESGDAQMQQIVDDMAQIFVEDVARYRGVSVEKVLSDFGRGGLIVGKKAVEAGLADRIGSFESVLSEMSAGKKRKKMRPAASANSKPDAGANSGGEGMTFIEKLKALIDGESATAKDEGKPPATSSGESDEVKRLKAENEQLKTAGITRLKESAKIEAESFINAKIKGATVLPAVKEGFVESYVQAALDDEASPLADGKKRTATLKAQYEGRQAHDLTKEKTTADLPAGARPVADSDDSEEATLKVEAAEARAYAERANSKKS